MATVANANLEAQRPEQLDIEVDRNAHCKTRKRSQLSSQYFPPRKKARLEEVECNPTLQVEVESGTNKLRNEGTLLVTDNTSHNERHGSKRSKHCKRYRRPIIRLPTSKNGKRKSSKPPSFRELIAQGTVSHILRECQSKAFARRSSPISTVDSLYGFEDDTLHSPAQTFGGAVPLSSNDASFEGPMMQRVKKCPITPSRSASVPEAGLEEENEVFHDTNDGEVMKFDETKLLHTAKKQSRSSRGVVDSTDVQPLLRHTTTIEETPDENKKDLEPPQNESSVAHLPFNFMRGTPDAFLIPSLKANASQRSSIDSCVSPRSNLFVEQNTSSIPLATSTSTSDIYQNNFSPIRPRTRRRIMSPHATPINLHTQPFSPAEMPLDDDPLATPLSTPFDFMYTAGYTQQSTFDPPTTTEHMMPNTKISFPALNLASIVKYIFQLVAQWLRSLRSFIEERDVSPSATSFSTPTSSSPRSDPSNSSPTSLHLRITNKGTPYRYLSRRGGIQASLQLPTTSNRAFLSTNAKSSTPNSQDFEHKSTTRQSRNDSFVNNPSCIHPGPPNGWEGLFQPRAEEWKCMTCFYINPVEALSCDSCTALRERTYATNSTSAMGREETKDDSNLAYDRDFEKDQSEHVSSFSAGNESSDTSSKREMEAARTAEHYSTVAFNPEEEYNQDEGEGSKRVKVNSVIDLNTHNSATKTGNTHSLELPEDQAETQDISSNGKRVKVDVAQGLTGDIKAELALDAGGSPMSISPNSSGSKKKRNKSEEGDDDDLNQVSKLAREDVTESEIMATDDLLTNVDEIMEV